MNYSATLNKKNILITGGTGSFGYQMVKELSKFTPGSVRIFSRDEDKQRIMQEEFEQQSIANKLEFLIGDVRDYDRLYSATKDVDIVFHAAALKQVPAVESHPFEAVKTNVLGAYNVIKASVARKVKTTVAISTDKAVKPVNAMGMTKALQEKIFLSDDLEKNGTTFCCVRYGNVLGSRGSVIPVWDSKIKNNLPIPITHPRMTRFMLTLTQAIDLVFYAVKNSKGGEIFVKKAPASNILDFANAYTQMSTGKKNYPIKFIGIRPGEKIAEILVSEEEMRSTVEKKDHFVIMRPKTNDVKSIKNTSSFSEYNSATVPQLSISETQKLIKSINWII